MVQIHLAVAIASVFLIHFAHPQLIFKLPHKQILLNDYRGGINNTIHHNAYAIKLMPKDNNCTTRLSAKKRKQQQSFYFITTVHNAHNLTHTYT